MCLAFRPVLKNGGTYEDANEYAKGLKVYHLKDADNPPPTVIKDAFPTNFDCLPYYDFSYWEDVNDVVQRNPVRTQDKIMINLLKSLGIEKGKAFSPTAKQKKSFVGRLGYCQEIDAGIFYYRRQVDGAPLEREI